MFQKYQAKLLNFAFPNIYHEITKTQKNREGKKVCQKNKQTHQSMETKLKK